MDNWLTQSSEETFNTELSEEEEKQFRLWILNTRRSYGIDLLPDLNSYDLRGYWKSQDPGMDAFAQRKGHAPDTYKKPSHPTFSNESIYSSDKIPGGSWEYKDGKEIFHPSDWQKFVGR